MAAEALEKSALEGKDKDQLLQIAKALGVSGVSKLKKSDLVVKIIEAAGGPSDAAPSPAPAPTAAVGSPATASSLPSDADRSNGADAPAAATTSDDSPAERPSRFSRRGAPAAAAASVITAAPQPDTQPEVMLGADGEPLADWEIELAELGVSTETTPAGNDSGGSTPSRSNGDRDGGSNGSRNDSQRNRNNGGGNNGGGSNGAGNNGGGNGRNQNPQSGGGGQNPQGGGNRNPQAGGQGSDRNDADGNKRRRRRRKGGRGQEGPQGEDIELFDDDGQPQSNEPIDVAGYLDMRDEGYGFLRINGYLPSAEDAYIPVKLARQYGLRKGDQLAGKMRPPGRNEKNPALLEVFTVNGGDPEVAKRRPRFEDLTALFPDEQLKLEDPADPTNMTARIIDLISPIGKGQRGILVSPPKAGKTTIMKTIAKMIEKNNPEVELIMLLIDERPEEVTDIRRTVKGEVISSTFDRPSDEHTAIAEMTIAKAKRMVEAGKDVVIMLDGITRLSRAYNLAAPASGRILSGGIDAGALYPPKKFFGAARNIEEGGSLTILATALVDTNSRMDEAIFEEFKGTGNMELRLDRKVAERRIYPAIDVDASSTRHEELLFDRRELQMVWKLRRVLSGLAADGNAAPGLELLMDRLKTFKSNSEFLSEIAKQPGM
jgi:transcription termination factor Rho